MTSKHEFRVKWKEKYPKDEGEKKRRDLFILELLLKSEVFLKAPTVGLYVARASEVELRALWQKRPDACVFPRCIPSIYGMDFFRIGDWSDLRVGVGGILEPSVSKGFQILKWEADSLILVPGIVFNRSGGRIGSGKGYYDRFLSTLPKGVQIWGICYSEQLVEEEFPQEPTDVKMHGVITDEGFSSVDL